MLGCRFAHSFKIVCVPHPIVPFRAPPQPVQVLRSGRGGEINVPYIRCLSGWVPVDYELWALAEDGVCEVHPYTRVELLSNFREDTSHTHFFNARQFQIPFLGCRAVNESVEFLDVARTNQHVRSCVASWNKNIFVHSWGLYPSIIPPNFSTITRRAYNLPVTFHGLVLRSNHGRLRLKSIESRRIRVEELLVRIRQYIRDEVRANVRVPVNNVLVDALSDDSDSDDGWLMRFDSN